MSDRVPRTIARTEVNRSIAIGINFVDHVLQLSLGRVLPERAHDSSELLGGDGAIAVCVACGMQSG